MGFEIQKLIYELPLVLLKTPVWKAMSFGRLFFLQLRVNCELHREHFLPVFY